MKQLSLRARLVFLAPLLLMSSCIESDSSYTLNPDGSGKVMHQVKFKKTAGNWMDDDPARTFALGFIRGTRGVEAWDDVHYRMADGGQAVGFRGTAYFRNLDKVSLGSFLKDGNIQELPIPLVSMSEKDGKQVVTLKDSPAAEMETKMEVTIGGVPIPDSKNKEKGAEKDSDLSGLGSLMAASFALSSDIKTSIHINGKVTGANGFVIDDKGQSATFHYHPESSGVNDKEVFAKQFGKKVGEKPGKTDFDEVMAGGIFENDKLQTVVSGETPPFTATLKFEGESFDFDEEVAKADFKLTAEEAAGWKKLESLEP